MRHFTGYPILLPNQQCHCLNDNLVFGLCGVQDCIRFYGEVLKITDAIMQGFIQTEKLSLPSLCIP